MFFFVKLGKTPGYFPMCPLKPAFWKCQFCFFPLDFVLMSCFIYSYVAKKKSYAAFKSQSLIHTNKAATPLIVKSSFYLVLSVF